MSLIQILIKKPYAMSSSKPTGKSFLPLLSDSLAVRLIHPKTEVSLKATSGFSVAASLCIQTEPPLISALCCCTAPAAANCTRNLSKSELKHQEFCSFSVLTITSVNSRITFKIPHLCFCWFSTHILTQHAHSWENILSFNINRLSK